MLKLTVLSAALFFTGADVPEPEMIPDSPRIPWATITCALEGRYPKLGPEDGISVWCPYGVPFDRIPWGVFPVTFGFSPKPVDAPVISR